MARGSGGDRVQEGLAAGWDSPGGHPRPLRARALARTLAAPSPPAARPSSPRRPALAAHSRRAALRSPAPLALGPSGPRPLAPAGEGGWRGQTPGGALGRKKSGRSPEGGRNEEGARGLAGLRVLPRAPRHLFLAPQLGARRHSHAPGLPLPCSRRLDTALRGRRDPEAAASERASERAPGFERKGDTRKKSFLGSRENDAPRAPGDVASLRQPGSLRVLRPGTDSPGSPEFIWQQRSRGGEDRCSRSPLPLSLVNTGEVGAGTYVPDPKAELLTPPPPPPPQLTL